MTVHIPFLYKTQTFKTPSPIHFWVFRIRHKKLPINSRALIVNQKKLQFFQLVWHGVLANRISNSAVTTEIRQSTTQYAGLLGQMTRQPSI